MLRSFQVAVDRLNKQYHGGTFQPPKRKQPTKGFRQIMKENAETVNFYRNLIMGVSFLRPVLSLLINGQLSSTGLTTGSVLPYVSIPLLLLLLLAVMIKQAIPLYNNSVEEKLLYPGHDLSMPGGCGDVLKDAIILLVLTHVLSVTSPMFWHILLLLLVRFLHVTWKYVIYPYFASKKTGGCSRNNKRVKKIKKNTKKPKKCKYRRTIKHWHHFR